MTKYHKDICHWFKDLEDTNGGIQVCDVGGQESIQQNPFYRDWASWPDFEETTKEDFDEHYNRVLNILNKLAEG